MTPDKFFLPINNLVSISCLGRGFYHNLLYYSVLHIFNVYFFIICFFIHVQMYNLIDINIVEVEFFVHVHNTLCLIKLTRLTSLYMYIIQCLIKLTHTTL